MRKIFCHYSFIIPVILFMCHQLIERILQIHFTLIDNFLDPFCASVLIIHALAAERRILFDVKLTIMDVVVATVILTLISELLFPYLSDLFTADLLDVIPFTVGAIWFVFTRKELLSRI